MNILRPANARVLAALMRQGAGKPQVARHDSVPAAQAYLGHGCHPDVVERLWDQLGAALPGDCRHLVYGTPALLHPDGLILARGIGMAYGLRILASASQAAADAGAKTVTSWSGGGGMDIRADYGADWIFGAWSVLEQDWCKAVYAAADAAGPGQFVVQAVDATPTARDPAVVVAEQQQAHQAQLEQRAAAGDPEAMFSLSQVLMNAAFKQQSASLLDRAGSLLASAAAAGHPKAVAMSTAWPRLKAEAARKFSAGG